MAKLFHMEIVSPEAAVYEGDVESLVAPAAMGYLGVLADHAPLASDLAEGKITLREAQGKIKVFNSQGKGFIHVFNNRVTLISAYPVAPLNF